MKRFLFELSTKFTAFHAIDAESREEAEKKMDEVIENRFHSMDWAHDEYADIETDSVTEDKRPARASSDVQTTDNVLKSKESSDSPKAGAPPLAKE